MWSVFGSVLLKQLPKQLEKRGTGSRCRDDGVTSALIVGFSGAPGSGKTTLVKRLREELLLEGYDVCIVKEAVHDIFERWKGKDKGFRSLEEIRCSDRALEFQLEVLREQVTREDRAAEKHEVVLIDRTVYDNLFYALFYPGTPKSLRWFEEYVETFERVCSARMYDIIFLCEISDCSDEYRNEQYRNEHEHGCECGHGHGHEYRYGYGYERECGCELDDGFRISDEYRKLQQYAIEKLIPESTPVCPVPPADVPADVDERVQFCLEVLHELQNELGREEVRKWC